MKNLYYRIRGWIRKHWATLQRIVRRWPPLRKLRGKPRFIVWEEHGTLTVEIVDTYRTPLSYTNSYAAPGRSVWSFGTHSANHDSAWDTGRTLVEALNRIEDPYDMLCDLAEDAAEENWPSGPALGLFPDLVDRGILETEKEDR